MENNIIYIYRMSCRFTSSGVYDHLLRAPLRINFRTPFRITSAAAALVSVKVFIKVFVTVFSKGARNGVPKRCS